MDLTRQEAIEVLKANYPTANYSELREAVDMALAMLLKQEAVATDTNVLSKWISVKDRLPEVHFADGSKVLVAFKIHDDHFGDIIDVDTAEFNQVFGGAGLDDCLARAGYDPFEVTHWMPLPEPPEELLDDTKQND